MFPNTKLLDIGCNEGEFFTYPQERKIFGYWIDPYVVKKNYSFTNDVTLIKSKFPSPIITDKDFDNICA